MAKKSKAKKEEQEDDPYFVRFVRNGKLRYGTVDRWSKEGRKAFKAGYYRINDAILPVVAEMKKDRFTVVDGESYYKFIEKDFKAAKKNAKKIPFVRTLKVGHIFGVGVADGTAWYIVTEVKGELCKISWRGWCHDHWIAPFFGHGGEFRIQDVRPLVWLEKCERKIHG